MTVAAARSALFDLLAANDDGRPVPALAEHVTRVFRAEPTPGTAPKPCSVTLFTLAPNPTDYRFRLSVYQALEPDVVEAQDNLVAVIDAIDALFVADKRYGRTGWEDPTYVEILDSLVITTVIDVGREDF